MVCLIIGGWSMVCLIIGGWSMVCLIIGGWSMHTESSSSYERS